MFEYVSGQLVSSLIAERRNMLRETEIVSPRHRQEVWLMSGVYKHLSDRSTVGEAKGRSDPLTTHPQTVRSRFALIPLTQILSYFRIYVLMKHVVAAQPFPYYERCYTYE